MSLQPVASLSLATRLLRVAETLGFTGEGAVAIPVMSHNDLGVVNIVVSDEELNHAPTGTIVLEATSRKFKQASLNGEGDFEWADLGNGSNLSVVLDTTPSSPTGPLPLPTPPVPEDPATSFITPPVVSINTQASETICKPDGTLIHGSGNPSGSMVVASNSEIYLAGACRFYRAGDAFPASSEGTYSINVADSAYQARKDWTWVYSISMLDTRNAKNICELYHVSLRVTNIKTGKSLRFAAEANSSTFDLYDSFNSLRITDNTTDVDFSLCQNIQRIEFYKAKLGLTDADVGGSGAPIGDYTFRLEARRKIGDFPPVVCEWGASVEDVDTSMIVSPKVVVNKPLNAIQLKSNGTLITGSGNSAEQMVVASNGEIEIAGACRFYAAGPLILPDGHAYSANVQSSKHSTKKDWTWVYSMALVNTANGDCLTDLYDVTMTVTEEHGSLEFVASYDDGVFHFVDSQHSLDIVDNSTTPTGRIAQNIQRIAFYQELMGASTGVSSGSPVGDYSFEIRAVRKSGNFPPVVANWTAHIEDHDLSMLVAPTQQFNVPLNAIQLKSNGTLITGSGNQSTSMASTSNGEIEIAGACRFYRNSPADMPVDMSGAIPTWRLNLQDSADVTLKDWTWVYCAAVIDSRNGTGIADLYNLTMTVQGANGQLVFSGSFDGTVFHMADSSNGLDIVDNSTTAEGQLCQNIQRVTFYKVQLTPTLGELSGSPIGEYTFTLRAERKIGGTVPPVVCSWKASISDAAIVEDNPPVD